MARARGAVSRPDTYRGLIATMVVTGGAVNDASVLRIPPGSDEPVVTVSVP